ncbi:caspase-3 [Baffinella frigidus]|nr:caspase-3 [Cryptophyta sp. CCMP2293]
MSVVSPALWTACGQGRVAEVRQLLADGADIEERGGPGAFTTPLLFAASNSHVLVARVLLEHGVDVSARDICGSTPLHWAAIQGLDEMTRLLPAYGADVSSKSIAGWTPEDLATSFSHPQVAAMLKAERVCRA